VHTGEGGRGVNSGKERDETTARDKQGPGGSETTKNQLGDAINKKNRRSDLKAMKVNRSLCGEKK